MKISADLASLSTVAPRRQLGLMSAAAVVAGESIAVGIFLTPAGMAKSLGSPFWLLVVWIVIGVLAVCGALTYGELSARFPRDGGIYVYLLETYGRGTAFLYGWMCLLVLDPGLTAALAVGLASYAGYILTVPSGAAKLTALGVIWAVGVLNIFSVRMGAGVLRWATGLKLGLLALLIFWALTFRLGSWTNFLPFFSQRAGSLPLGPALGAAMVGAFFSFGGWWEVSKIAGEVRDPGRTLPRAMLIGVLIVTSVYVLVSAIFLYLVPLEKVTSDEAFVAQVGAILFGPTGATIFAAIVILCILSSMAAMIMCAPRVYFAMAQDGLFLRSVASLHPRFGSPARAICIQASIASVLVLFGSFQQIISYFVFIAVVFLAMAGAGIFIARSRREAIPAFLAPLYPVPPLIFLLLMAALLFLLLMHSPRQALLGATVVLAGLPVYKLFSRSHQSHTHARKILEEA